jgi:crotonobetainyl-CoA:carnitine CoA-transferase CaiB-like acyl-CoA transferase
MTALSGIRVIEIGTLIAAPFAARIMAEFGAEVIKIETLGQGDPLRKWRKLHEGTSLWWYLQSRNKKSLALNLKSPEGIAIVKQLAQSADVLIENLRPGALEKLGIGWDVLRELNPKLTLVRISGYGQSGPYRDRPGFGAIGEAMGGIRYTTGTPGIPPARVGVSLGDSLASMHAVIGALMSLLRVKTGQGKWWTYHWQKASSTSWKVSCRSTTCLAMSVSAAAARYRVSRHRTPTLPAMVRT